ncbi:MAG: ABC transporter permease [Siculibacillus sp.]|nr:ABC transporter permease [Siculibacillus sp.]
MEERFVRLIQEAIGRLEDPSGPNRVELYNRVRKALIDHLDRLDPPLGIRDRMGHIRRVEQSIRRIEADFKQRAKDEPKRAAPKRDPRSAAAARSPAGGRPALPAPGRPPERPPGRAPEWRRVGIERYRPSRRERAVGRDAGAEAMAVYLLPANCTEAGIRPKPPGSTKERLRDLVRRIGIRARVQHALLRRQTKEALTHDRLHFLWMLLEPIVQVGLVVVLYWLLNRTYVLDMPAFSFAIVGIAGWLMFRNVGRVLATGAGREDRLLNFPVITRIDVVLTRGIYYGLLYLVIAAFFLWAVWALGLGSAVTDVGLFLWWWTVLWLFAIGFGLSNMALIDTYPALRKFIPLMMRKVIYFSGVVLCTEQLPESYKIYFLWNPIIHANQLMRSALFVEYETVDASPGFLLVCTLVMLIFGLAAERANRRKVPKL